MKFASIALYPLEPFVLYVCYVLSVFLFVDKSIFLFHRKNMCTAHKCSSASNCILCVCVSACKIRSTASLQYFYALLFSLFVECHFSPKFKNDKLESVYR